MIGPGCGLGHERLTGPGPCARAVLWVQFASDARRPVGIRIRREAPPVAPLDHRTPPEIPPVEIDPSPTKGGWDQLPVIEVGILLEPIQTAQPRPIHLIDLPGNGGATAAAESRIGAEMEEGKAGLGTAGPEQLRPGEAVVVHLTA